MSWLEILFFLIIGITLYMLGSDKKDRTTWFYLIIILVYIIPVLLVLNQLMALMGIWFYLFALIWVLNMLGFSTALYEVSGKKEIGWFIIIYVMPIIGWIIYRFTKLKW